MTTRLDPLANAARLPISLSVHSAPIPSKLAVREADPLTPRELSIVQLIAKGCSNAEIARELHLAEPTVKANLGRVMVKWGVRDRVQALIYAITNEVVEVDALHLDSSR